MGRNRYPDQIGLPLNPLDSQIRRADPQPPDLLRHRRPDRIHEPRPLHVPQPARCAVSDEHADAAPDDDQPVVLKALIGLSTVSGLAPCCAARARTEGNMSPSRNSPSSIEAAMI